MRRPLIGMAVLAGISAAIPASAQDTESFAIRTDIPPFCSQLESSATPMDLGNLTGASGQIVSGFTGTEVTRELSASFYCNAPATVTLTALPLMNEAVAAVGDTGSFTNRVDYTASLKWRELEGSVSSTAATGQEIVAPEANIGPVTLALSRPVVARNLRPVAGSYAGMVRLTVTLTQ